MPNVPTASNASGTIGTTTVAVSWPYTGDDDDTSTAVARVRTVTPVLGANGLPTYDSAGQAITSATAAWGSNQALAKVSGAAGKRWEGNVAIPANEWCQIQVEYTDSAPTPPANLLAEYAPYSQSSGQAMADTSGNARHATLGTTSSVETSDPAWVTGGLELTDGDRVTLPTSAVSGTAMTVVIAIKTPDTVDFARLLTITHSTGYLLMGYSTIANARHLVESNDGTTSTYVGPGNGTVPANSWRCLYFTYDRAAADIVTGEIVAGAIQDKTSNLAVANLPSATVSGVTLGGSPSDGIIGYVAIYGAVKSDADILAAAAGMKTALATVGVTLP
jgi:hypothetical protein